MVIIFLNEIANWRHTATLSPRIFIPYVFQKFLNPYPIINALFGIPTCLGKEISLDEIAIKRGRVGILIFDTKCARMGFLPMLITDDQGSSASFQKTS